MQNVVKWKAVYDSVQGTSHDVRGLPCQDSCRVVSYSIESDELLIAVCADGAGSAEHSDIGSLIACDRFVEICESHFVDAGSLDEVSNELVSDWLTQIRSSISAKAEELLVDLGQLATTLLGLRDNNKRVRYLCKLVMEPWFIGATTVWKLLFGHNQASTSISQTSSLLKII